MVLIIDCKKFLEEYAEEPPSPPKKKREVDLKPKPSKFRIAAEKYSRSKYFTKPTHLPRPVRKRRGKTSTPAVSSSVELQMETANPLPLKQQQPQYQLLRKKLKRQSKHC